MNNLNLSSYDAFVSELYDLGLSLSSAYDLKIKRDLESQSGNPIAEEGWSPYDWARNLIESCVEIYCDEFNEVEWVIALVSHYFIRQDIATALVSNLEDEIMQDILMSYSLKDWALEILNIRLADGVGNNSTVSVEPVDAGGSRSLFTSAKKVSTTDDNVEYSDDEDFNNLQKVQKSTEEYIDGADQLVLYWGGTKPFLDTIFAGDLPLSRGDFSPNPAFYTTPSRSIAIYYGKLRSRVANSSMGVVCFIVDMKQMKENKIKIYDFGGTCTKEFQEFVFTNRSQRKHKTLSGKDVYIGPIAKKIPKATQNSDIKIYDNPDTNYIDREVWKQIAFVKEKSIDFLSECNRKVEYFN